MRLLRHRRTLLFSGALLLATTLVLGAGLLLYRRATYALRLTIQVQAELAAGKIEPACADVATAASAWRSAAQLSRPFAPIVRNLGWLPRVGADLRVAPAAIGLAQHGAAAAASACTILRPALAATTMPARLTAAAQQLSAQPETLTTIRNELAAARADWQSIAPFVAASPRLAPYQTQLRDLDGKLAAALGALDTANTVAPQLPWLLGLDTPRRFLVVVQNPFELRPTGGFIGLVCTVQVAQAQPRLEGCQPSESYTAAQPGATMPFAYTRYLQLGGYYLRDANWSPDFPTTAATLQQFWALNKQPAVDGVVAADPYLLVPLLQAIGPLQLADGTQIDAEQSVDALLRRYYDGKLYRDKNQLAALLPALFQRLQQVEPAALPRVLGAMETGLAERHLLVSVSQPTLAAALARQQWDGGIARAGEHTLRIVDADVGYGAVNGFVERLTRYDLALDDQAQPLTATLTLTYTNRYSPWAEAPTSFAVNGQCTNPATQQLEPRRGCYADYLRIYVPQGSRLIAASGLEESLGVDQQFGRTIFGGYLRINPGEQRVVQFQYRLPSFTSNALTIEKQPGTVAPPYFVTARTATGATTFYTTGRTDISVTIRNDRAGPVIEGSADPAAGTSFARQAAFSAGRDQWRAGNRTEALRIWQAGGAVDRALDDARAQTATEDALALLRAIDAVTTDGRAAFEQASILEAQGKLAEAEQLYRQAATRSPDNPLAQLQSARLLAASGQSLPALQQLASTSAAVRRWRAAADELEQTGALTETIAYLGVLLQVTPTDRALELRLAEVLLRAGRRDQASARYAALATGADIWGRLAGARAAQLAERRDEAVRLYSEALPLADTEALAFNIGDRLRDLGARTAAVRAYERAATLAPGSIWPLLAAGNTIRDQDQAAARDWYRRAGRVDPASGYPDFALGSLLLDQGEPAAARPLLTAAVAKQPEVQAFRDALARVEALTASSASATITRTP